MSLEPTLKAREDNLIRKLAGIALVSVWSGLVTWLAGTESIPLQFCVVLHAMSGIILAIALVAYLLMHFRRVVGIRRPITMITGIVLVLILVIASASGTYLMIAGISEPLRWVLNLHIVCSIGSLILCSLHLAAHWFTPKRTSPSGQGLPGTPTPWIAALSIPSLGSAVMVGLLSITYVLASPPVNTKPVVTDYDYSYGSHPFRPSRTETYHGQFVPQALLAQSDGCADCHIDIAAQWQVSAHRHAADDPSYVTNIELLSDRKGIAATRYCEGCHAPVALLSGQLSAGGDHGGISGSAANTDGVGCLACHGVDHVVDTKGVASYQMGPPSRYLFAQASNQWQRSIRNMLIRLSPAMHRQEMSPKGVEDSSFCASCHVQFMDKDMNDWGWVKMQDEYSAWLESPFSGHNTDEFGNTSVLHCQDCHMPSRPGKDPSRDKLGNIASHFFVGANTMLAQHFGHEGQLSRTKDFLRSGRLSVTIEPPHRGNAMQTQQSLREDVRARSETPAYAIIGESVAINVSVSNRGVGHDFPGGTVDINEAWLEFIVMDGNGDEVYASGKVSGDEYTPLGVDPSAEFYRSRPVDRLGNLVWKHDLFNRVGTAEKRIVPAGKTDLLTYTFEIPDWTSPPITIVATLKYRKLNDRYARWVLGNAYQEIAIVDVARSSLVVPIKTKLDVI